MTTFPPKQREPSRSRQSNIMKKSRKEFQTTIAHMNSVSVGQNLGSRPTKRYPLEDVNQSRAPMIKDSSPQEKNIEASRPTQFKAMVGLVHKENRVNRVKLHDTFSSRLKDRSNLNQGHINGVIEDNVLIMDHTNGRGLSSRMFGKDLSNNPMDKKSSMNDKRVTFNCIDPVECKEVMGQVADSNDRTDNGKRSRGSLLDGKPKINVVEQSQGSMEDDNQTYREMKRLRRRKVIFEEDDSENFGDQNDTSIQISKAATNFHAKFHIGQNCCSKPIDEPTWRGIFKVGQKYVSLAGHLSTKYGDKVWKLSRSLMPIVEVAKICRSKAWPKKWEALKPNGDDIGLYFLPHDMRANEEFDQLVKEVMENDLVLQAIIGEAEMLIFPSILLPEQYKTFKGKYYLWGVFKPSKHDRVPLNAIGCCAHEVEKEPQHLSIHQDEVQCKEQDQETSMMNTATPLEYQELSSNKNTCEVQATSIHRIPNMDFEPRAPKEGRQGDALHLSMCSSDAMDNATNGGTPANQGGIDPNRVLSSGRVFGFVVGQTPRLLQLIREMEREGGVVIAMHGRQ